MRAVTRASARFRRGASSDGVLDAATRSETREISLGGTLDSGAVALARSETPPRTRTGSASGPRSWAELRLVAKGRRNFAEADRIRALLAKHGWQVRDKKDGGSEVSRS